MNEQEKIDRFSEAYRAMVDAGIFASTFEGSYQIPRLTWEMHFAVLRPTEREVAKSHARAFLEMEYDAKGIKFYREGSSETKFYAVFMRGDV